MARYSYEALANDKVKFLQGTQAQLNLYLPNAPATIPNGMENAGSANTFKGHAEEGAFYLTTDTQRLYIGRKVTAVPNPNDLNIAIGDIYPEEISQGIATVVDAGELLSAQTGGEARDGDFYYIKSTNVLAVYEDNGDGTGSWQQINSPTGITTFNTIVANVNPATANFSASANYVRIVNTVGTPGNSSMTAAYWIKAGDNITLKPSQENNAIEISSANSQSTLSTTATEADINKAPIILSDGINADTLVYLIGENDTTIKSDVVSNENRITISGPNIVGDKITSLGVLGSTASPAGFNFQIQVNNGNTSSIRSTTAVLFDPLIRIGETAKDVHFHAGRADLDVYTIAEVDSKISDAITDELKNVNALHYKGTIDSVSAINALDNGATVGVGDVYVSSATAPWSYEGSSIRTGDMFIATLSSTSQGENAQGYIPTGDIVWEIVPSGNEPLLKGTQFAATGGQNPSFGLLDENIEGTYATVPTAFKKDKRPLYVTFDNANSTLITAEGYGTADDFKIRLHHDITSTTGSVTAVTAISSVTASSGTDSLGKDVRATFYAIKNIVRDLYGHVVQVDGTEVTLRHNYLSKLKTAHSVTNNIGTVSLTAEDVLGFANTAISVSNNTAGIIKLGSDTLSIGASSDNTQLNINMIWGSF